MNGRESENALSRAIIELMKESAGTLLYRLKGGTIEVLLIHPSGNYNRKAPWGIPKGLVDPGENAEQTARRETIEETGVVAGELVDLSTIVYQKSRKRVHAFAGEGAVSRSVTRAAGPA
jgi:predicted NUDIX family NTP pyrophosphohydrolase